MFESIQELAKYQPGFAAIIIAMFITIVKQASSENKTIIGGLFSIITVGLLVYALLLQAKNQVKEIARKEMVSCQIKYLEHVLEDNNLTIKNMDEKLKYDKQLQNCHKLENLF